MLIIVFKGFLSIDVFNLILIYLIRKKAKCSKNFKHDTLGVDIKNVY